MILAGMPMPKEIQHHILAFREHSCASVYWPMRIRLSIREAYTIAGMPKGRQQHNVTKMDCAR